MLAVVQSVFLSGSSSFVNDGRTQSNSSKFHLCLELLRDPLLPHRLHHAHTHTQTHIQRIPFLSLSQVHLLTSLARHFPPTKPHPELLPQSSCHGLDGQSGAHGDVMVHRERKRERETEEAAGLSAPSTMSGASGTGAGGGLSGQRVYTPLYGILNIVCKFWLAHKHMEGKGQGGDSGGGGDGGTPEFRATSVSVL